MVEVNGACSNPRVQLELLRLGELWIDLLEARPRAKPKQVVPRAGEVAIAVFAVLSEAQSAMRAKEIHLACEIRLGRSIRSGTVRDCLSEHSKGPKSKYLRVGRGRYLVRPLIK